MQSSILDQYQYDVPKELIAATPIEPRDHARVLVYDTATDTVTIDHFYHLSRHVPQESLLVMNTTRVVPARVILYKPTGGKIECLFLVNEGIHDGALKIIVDRKLEPGTRLIRDEYVFDVVAQDEQFFFVRPQFPVEHIATFLERYGTTPTPKYLGKQSLSEQELRTRYQSLLADKSKSASVAAPTASLHFTDEVFASLRQQGTLVAPVTLHVGMGTFAPVDTTMIENKQLHTETYEIPQTTTQQIQRAKESKKPVIAVGTTVTRTLETVGAQLITNNANTYTGATSIFILPPYDFTVVDQLITNFHVPASSLMCLVDAFLQHKKAKRGILELYAIAIEHQMRFFSFGDAMYIK